MKQYTRVEMREIMEIRGFSKNTIEIYINHIKNLAAYFNKPPHTLSPEHIHTYQVFLVQEKQVGWSTFNQAVCSMRFFLTMWWKMTGQLHTFLSKRDRQRSLLCSTEKRYNHFFPL
ncbi:MAG: phage integrase N-terminal SAM-like domain-containing protein [Spirochaetales bacterium]|nr:phage integrase N-terminal SAM-like domain-containing protein [Spirochaetales bacterium]